MRQSQHNTLITKNKRLNHSLALVGIVLFLGAGESAWADSSCSTFLATKAKTARATGQVYNTQLTMHRDGIPLVSYSTGFLGPNPDGTFSGSSNQLFSDRTKGAQGFDVAQADWLDVRLSSTGLLSIYYHPWNFGTTWDLSCKGSLLTTYVPNFGVVTLTFRDLRFPDGTIY